MTGKPPAVHTYLLGFYFICFTSSSHVKFISSVISGYFNDGNYSIGIPLKVSFWLKNMNNICHRKQSGTVSKTSSIRMFSPRSAVHIYMEKNRPSFSKLATHSDQIKGNL